jgi:hypothetical protein
VYPDDVPTSSLIDSALVIYCKVVANATPTLTAVKSVNSSKDARHRANVCALSGDRVVDDDAGAVSRFDCAGVSS